MIGHTAAVYRGFLERFANIRREAFHRVIHLPLKTVLKTGPSDLISRVVYDTTTTLVASVVILASKATSLFGNE